MSTDAMLDLTITPLDGGAFELSQQGGSLDEPCMILLHQVQVRYLAEHAGLIQRPAPALPRIRRDIERLRGKAVDLFELLASVPCFPPQENPSEDVVAAQELVESIDNLLEDIGGALPAAPVTDTALRVTRHDKSAAISVTPTPTPKRGRPAKPDALTPAERQRAHRERQAELLPVTRPGGSPDLI